MVPFPDFSAVLLAGGRSSRMGQDKAGLMIDGEPLWRRQLATLLATGAKEIMISGRFDGPYADSGVPIIEDPEPGQGPLGGIVAAAQRARFPRVLVLAIDLPRMNAEYLRGLVGEAPMVPRRDGRFEPLAAVYSRALLELFREQLAQGERSLQRLLRELASKRQITMRDVPREDASLFDNLNTPEDLAYFVGG